MAVKLLNEEIREQKPAIDTIREYDKQKGLKLQITVGL
jgi:hypothetical protein